jgi:hypothetical protein
MRPGEIYLAQFPFGDVPGMKLHCSSLARHLGALDAHQQAAVVAKLKELLGL